MMFLHFLCPAAARKEPPRAAGSERRPEKRLLPLGCGSGSGPERHDELSSNKYILKMSLTQIIKCQNN